MLLRPVDAGADADALYRVSHPPAGDPSIWTYLFDGPFADVAALPTAIAHACAQSPPCCAADHARWWAGAAARVAGHLATAMAAIGAGSVD